MLQSWLATLGGEIIVYAFDMIFGLTPVILQTCNLESVGQSRDTIVRVVSNIIAENVPKMVLHLKSEVQRNAELPPEFSLRIVAVIAGFVLLSATAAWSLRPSASRLGFGRCLNSAICGPLYLLAHAEDRSLRDTCGYVSRLICLRGLFLASMVAFTWRGVAASHAEVCFAAVNNENVSYRWICLRWLAFALAHAVTGFSAVLAIKTSAQSLEREAVDVPLETLSDAGPPRGMGYRSFPVRQARAG